MKKTSSLKKSELIDAMLLQDQIDAKAAKEAREKEAGKAREAKESGEAKETKEQKPAREKASYAQDREPADRQDRNYQQRQQRQAPRQPVRPDTPIHHKDEFAAELDSGEIANGILEVMPDGYGFIRCENYMPGDNDIYVAPSQIRRFRLKTGDILKGNIRVRTQGEKFSALLYVKSINGYAPEEATRRFNFEDMTPIFPD